MKCKGQRLCFLVYLKSCYSFLWQQTENPSNHPKLKNKRFFFFFPFYLSHAWIHLNFACNPGSLLVNESQRTPQKKSLDFKWVDSLFEYVASECCRLLPASKGQPGSSGRDFTGSLLLLDDTDTSVVSQCVRARFCGRLFFPPGCRVYKLSLRRIKPILLKSPENLLRGTWTLEGPFALGARCEGTLQHCVRHLAEGHFSGSRASFVLLLLSSRAACCFECINVSWRKLYTETRLLKIHWVLTYVFVGGVRGGKEGHRAVVVQSE